MENGCPFGSPVIYERTVLVYHLHHLHHLHEMSNAGTGAGGLDVCIDPDLPRGGFGRIVPGIPRAHAPRYGLHNIHIHGEKCL
eukprot:1191893-Prorocentrum_minimum.AAC.1